MSESGVIVNIDDHEPARYARSRVLKQAGFIVHDGGTGQAAIDLVGSVDPDLVLLDVHLPDADGIEICRQIKSTRASASVIVMQISASATGAPQMTSALNNGADAYLAEPVDPDVLVATVRAMLRLRKAERSLAAANRRLDAVNRELRRSNEDLESFAYIASHDLQEPLRTVTVFTQLLQRSLGDRLHEEEAANMGMVISAANRMRALLNDLLEYAQLGRDSGKYTQIQLAESVAWATANLSELITESRAAIDFHDLPVVRGDSGQLGHVFLNLISNAIKYRSPDRDPHIHISSTGSSVEVIVRVRDNGIGIEPQYLKQVFVPFKRLHGRQIPGNGIGLAVCQRIIEAHGGRLWAESELNVGSEFCFALPVAVAS